MILSKREQHIAQLVATGLPNKLVARQCYITLRTVKAHLTAIYSKLGITNRTQLAVYMLQQQYNSTTE